MDVLSRPDAVRTLAGPTLAVALVFGGLSTGCGDGTSPPSPEPAPTPQAGTLDPSFGEGGISRHTIPGRTALVADLASGPDGSVVVLLSAVDSTTSGATSAVVARVLPEGGLDPSFGDAGLVDRVLCVGAAQECDARAAGLFVLPDGRILFSWVPPLPSETRGGLALVSPAGELVQDVSLPELADVRLVDFALDTDHSVVAVGSERGRPAVVRFDPALIQAEVRSFDSFSDDGERDNERFSHVVIQEDGAILAAGGGSSQQLRIFFGILARLRRDLSLDRTFGGFQVFEPEGCYSGLPPATPEGFYLGGWSIRAPVVTENQALVLPIDNGPGGRLTTLTPSGRVVRGWADDGSVCLSGDVVALVPTSHGATVLALNVLVPGIDDGASGRLNRYSPDGDLDPSFGDQGTARVPRLDDEAMPLQAVLKRPSGRILVGAGLGDRGWALLQFFE